MIHRFKVPAFDSRRARDRAAPAEADLGQSDGAAAPQGDCARTLGEAVDAPTGAAARRRWSWGRGAQDVAVVALAALAAATPFVAPAIAPETSLVVSQLNPLVERVHLRAERSVVVSPEDIQTFWRAAPETRADRAQTPVWVREALDMPPRLTALEALGRPPFVIELDDGPTLRAASASVAAPERVAASARPAVAETLIAGLPGVGPTALDVVLSSIELTAPPPGPIASATFAAAPAARPAAGVPGAAVVSGGAPRLALSAPRSDAAPGVQVGPQERADRTLAPSPPPAPAKPAPEVSIVLTAVGLNPEATALAAQTLPAEIAFAVPPIAPNAADLVAAASAAGRVALLETPLQSDAFPRLNGAPMTLLTGAGAQRNGDKLTSALAATPGVTGVATYLGDRFVQDEAALTRFVAGLRRRGLFVLAADPDLAGPVLATAERLGARAQGASILLDAQGRAADLSDGLGRLEALARQAGRATGVAVAMPGSVSALADWSRDLAARGFRLVAVAP